MPVPSIVTFAVAPPEGCRLTVVWKLPLPVLLLLLLLPPVTDCWLSVLVELPVRAWLPVELWSSIWSPSDCELLDVLLLVELEVPPVELELVALLLEFFELPDVLLPVVEELFDMVEPE
jgi:hypothetical protein